MQNVKLFLFVIFGFLIVLGGFFVIKNKNQKTSQVIEKPETEFVIGQKAPSFTLKDFDGKEVSLSQFYGQKAVILDFWAAWCPFCVAEMPELEKAHQAYKDNLVMVGVHRTDSGELIATGEKFARERGVTYLLLQGTNEIYKASTSGISGMPVAVFIDKAGVVRGVKIGPKTAEEIAEKTGELLK